ncbi:suppressor APC domain-containing protein 2 [Culicoides brevitarsis]|uniref:suppressor APC domain-containing protein 2 n=1 Tax=Culicoides brevitarsis TaxID=469753 RepID=UPI00307BE3EB
MASTTSNNNVNSANNNISNNNSAAVQIGSGNQKLFQSSTNSLCSNNSDIEGLPKSFINAMRTLFDIMADPRTGFVRFSDIEQRWQEESQGMPLGVVESLRKVTPANGNLSFERFCNGLKICLVKNQTTEKQNLASYKRQVIGESTSPTNIHHGMRSGISPMGQKETRRPPSAPTLDFSTHLPKLQQPAPPQTHHIHPNTINNSSNNNNNTATVRPNNVQMSQRTLSMPQLSPDRDPIAEPQQPPQVHNIYSLGPPKPPRSMRLSAPAVPERLDKAEIRNALHNWQLNVIEGDKNKQQNRLSQGSPNSIPSNSYQRSSGDGQTDQNIYQKKATARRREPRRHTLQNGIDYNMLKRLKQIEQEKDVLLEGLSAVEKARDWYLKQIAIVQDKIKYLGRTGTHMVSQ